MINSHFGWGFNPLFTPISSFTQFQTFQNLLRSPFHPRETHHRHRVKRDLPNSYRIPAPPRGSDVVTNARLSLRNLHPLTFHGSHQRPQFGGGGGFGFFKPPRFRLVKSNPFKAFEKLWLGWVGWVGWWGWFVMI